MKIALINENSQASKNEIIYKALKKVSDKHSFEVYNYGMENAEEPNLTYVQAGLLAAILINSKAADFIVTGCGTGEGAMLALNSFPNMLCGHIVDPTDAYLFSQINAGNAVAIPYAKGFGWGSELTLENIFEKISTVDVYSTNNLYISSILNSFDQTFKDNQINFDFSYNVNSVINIPLNEEENEKYKRSVNVIKDAIRSLEK